MKIFWIVLIWICMSVGQGAAAVVGHEIDYQSGEVFLKGYLAYDDALAGQRPGVIIVHEWWGHNAYVRERARMLAQQGYVALAIDMYGEGKVASHPDEAKAFAREVTANQAVSKARFLAGLTVLRAQPMTDPMQVAAIGYCFGGGTVLTMARQGVDLRGVVSFHGSLGIGPIAEGPMPMAKVLVCHGAEDQFVTAQQIQAFKARMEAQKIPYQFLSYPGAKHSFTNPQANALAKKFNLDLAYHPKADQQSWADMLHFFETLFRQ